ncbi:NfeD family protein [Pseudomonas guariconensis]|uniref:NfeD family protein n=1 Tax=Pseudomonas guariconensis TaxID=1288410 RepID=UPI0039058E10
MQVEWWWWLVFGIALMLCELAVPTFFLFWFGIGAVLVSGVALLFSGLALPSQILIWLLLSVAISVVWFKVIRPKKAETRWTADAALGQVGLLTSTVDQFLKGRVRFQKPVLGSEEWVCVADDTIESGTRVRVIAVEGNTVRVSRA